MGCRVAPTRARLIAAIFACATAVFPASGASLKVSEAEAKRAAIEKPAPAYPLAALQLKITGTVLVEAAVTATGTVEQVTIVTGNAMLTPPVMDAVKKWRFKPFLSEGTPVPATVSLSFEFNRR